MTVGVLALQGGFALHESVLRQLNVDVRRIRYGSDLEDADGLIIPGGESSTMLKLGTRELWDGIIAFAATRPVWGICAGSILISRHVSNPDQESLGVIDIATRRNAYGAQNDSFIATVEIDLDKKRVLECVFIRAPKIVGIGPNVTVRATCNDDPIMVEENGNIATTFHPELSGSIEVHRYFVAKIETFRSER